MIVVVGFGLFSTYLEVHINGSQWITTLITCHIFGHEMIDGGSVWHTVWVWERFILTVNNGQLD